MSDETLSAAPELATATPVADEPQPVGELDNQQAPEVANEEPDDFEEFEFAGKQVRGPKGLKDGVLMHADYTRKTQEIASTRRELEERAARIEQQAKASEEVIAARATLHNVEGRIAEYAKLSEADWQRLEMDDPISAQQHWRIYQSLKEQKNEAAGKIQEAEAKRTQTAQQDFAKRVEQARQHAAKLPGWNANSEKALVDFATSKGISTEQFADLMSPAFVEIMHLAHQQEALLKKPPAKPTGPAPAPTQVVAGRTTPGATKSLADMDMEEYVAARKAGRKG